MLKTVGKILLPVLLTIPPLVLFAGRFLPESFGELAAAFDRERAALVESYPGMAVEVARPRPRRSSPAVPTGPGTAGDGQRQ